MNVLQLDFRGVDEAAASAGTVCHTRPGEGCGCCCSSDRKAEKWPDPRGKVAGAAGLSAIAGLQGH